MVLFSKFIITKIASLNGSYLCAPFYFSISSWMNYLTFCINILNITLIVKSVWYEFCSSIKAACLLKYLSPVIRQKSNSSNGGNKKTRHYKFSKKRTFITSSFFGKFDVLCFLVTSVLRVTLLPYHRRLELLVDIRR